MRRTDPTAATVRMVRERDDWRCARCGGWGPLSTQHRVARGMGGSRQPWKNEPANLLTLCGSGTTGCHGWIERRPAWAEAHGWSARQYVGDQVWRIPVWTWRGWVQLYETGLLAPRPEHPGVPDCDCSCRATETPAGLWAATT